MPRKTKKAKFKPYKVCVNQYGEIFANTGAVVGTSPVVSLSYLYEIFSSRIEKDVIKLVLQECDFNVDQASETLMSLCGDDSREVLNTDVSKDWASDCSLPLLETSCSKNVGPHAHPQYRSRSKSLTNISPEKGIPDTEAQNRIFQNVNEHHMGGSAFRSYSGVTNTAPSAQNFAPRSSNCFVSEGNSIFNMHEGKEIEANAAGAISKPFGNFKNSSPSFIVPSMTMSGLASPLQKSPGSETSRGFWNATDVKHFSTFDTKGSNRKEDVHLKEALDHIKSGKPILIILRGLPGSGKSTLALKLKYSGVIFSTDDFFMIRGKYLFDPNKLPEAHEWNKLRTKKALEKGLTPIIIDNTNVEAWEMKPYIVMGKKYNYQIVILEPDTPWKFNVNFLASRNKHRVPKSKIAKMKEKYQKNLTVEKVLGISDSFSAIADIAEQGDCATVDTVDANSNNACSTVKDNHVSLKAIVHMEDSSPAEGSLFGVDRSRLTDEEKNINSNDKIVPEPLSEASDSKNLADSETCVVSNLDDLRALANNYDSEDSCSYYSSTNSSSQDFSAWEAITERDHDFRWSSSLKEQPLHEKPARKSRSADNLHFKDYAHSSGAEAGVLSCTSSVEAISCDVENSSASGKWENMWEVVQDNSNLCPKVDCETAENIDLSRLALTNDSSCSYTELYIDDSNVSEFYDDKISENSNFSTDDEMWHKNDTLPDASKNFDINSNDTTMKSLECVNKESISCTEIKNQNLAYVPKPQRNNITNILSLSKNNFSEETLHDKSKNTEIFTSIEDWDAVDNQVEECSTEKQTEINISTPKPQRQIFRNTFPDKEGQNPCKLEQKHRQSFLNITPDSVGQVWEFPEFTVDEPCQDESGDKDILFYKLSSYSQTEPADFDSLYRVSSGADSSTLHGYNVISAKSCHNSFEATDDFKLSDDDENCKYSQVVSFDKSTSTDDMIDDIEISQKLSHLQGCFPDISKDDLLHLLEICYNDERWISNLLLDWGYKYNVPAENVDKSNANERKYDVNSEVFEKNADCFGWVTDTQVSCAGSSSDTDNVSLSSRSVSEESKDAEPTVEARAGDEKEKLILVLDSAFAHQLEELFGPVPNPENRQVNIDLELAEMIYEKWKGAVQHDESMNEDNQSASKSLKCKKKKSKQNDQNNKTPVRKPSSSATYNHEPTTLSEIMDMEMAQQIYREEKLNKNEDFMTKMKRSELYNLFPGADVSVLDEIFEGNNYSLEDSLHALGEDITSQETIEKKKTVAQFDARIKEWEKTNIFNEFVNGDWSDWVYKDENNAESVPEAAAPFVTPQMSFEAAELRAVAAEHFQLRQEFIAKAQAAYCRGMKDVASFYAQQGSEEGRIGKQTNKLAAALIAQEKNALNSSLKLDLHGLHVQEAISLLEKFLSDKKLEIQRRQYFAPCIVTVITGQGHHSLQGAKLRPAVINFLRSSKYNFTEIKTGQIEVTLYSD